MDKEEFKYFLSPGLHSKKDNGSLVACHSQGMIVELEVDAGSLILLAEFA